MTNNESVEEAALRLARGKLRYFDPGYGDIPRDNARMIHELLGNLFAPFALEGADRVLKSVGVQVTSEDRKRLKPVKIGFKDSEWFIVSKMHESTASWFNSYILRKGGEAYALTEAQVVERIWEGLPPAIRVWGNYRPLFEGYLKQRHNYPGSSDYRSLKECREDFQISDLDAMLEAIRTEQYLCGLLLHWVETEEVLDELQGWLQDNGMFSQVSSDGSCLEVGVMAPTISVGVQKGRPSVARFLNEDESDDPRDTSLIQAIRVLVYEAGVVPRHNVLSGALLEY